LQIFINNALRFIYKNGAGKALFRNLCNSGGVFEAKLLRLLSHFNEKAIIYSINVKSHKTAGKYSCRFTKQNFAKTLDNPAFYSI